MHHRPPGQGRVLVAPAFLAFEDREAVDRMIEARRLFRSPAYRVAGILQIARGQFLDHAAGIHDQHAVAEFRHQVQGRG